jgi:hypothetical protein
MHIILQGGVRHGIVLRGDPRVRGRSGADRFSHQEIRRFSTLAERPQSSAGDHDAELRRLHGKLAAFAWVGSSLFLFVTSSAADVFSVRAAAFVLVGMLGAALVFGNAGYWLQRAVVYVFVDRFSGLRQELAARIVHGVGIVLTLVEVAAVFLVARWLFGIVSGEHG